MESPLYRIILTCLFFLQVSIWLASFVATIVASPIQHLCKKHIQPQKALQRITRNFMIVDNALVEQMKPRKRRDVSSSSAIQGSSTCPWKSKLSKFRPHEVPSTFSKAVCPGCRHFCRPVRYTLRVLVNDGCDPKSGVSVWRWKQRKITIAYAYR